jgi:S-adenosylmethionine hydrolase
VTNLPPLTQTRYTVQVAGREYAMTFHPTYAAAPPDELFLIEGSNSTLEISLKNANAHTRLPLPPGQKITIS